MRAKMTQIREVVSNDKLTELYKLKKKLEKESVETSKARGDSGATKPVDEGEDIVSVQRAAKAGSTQGAPSTEEERSRGTSS